MFRKSPSQESLMKAAAEKADQELQATLQQLAHVYHNAAMKQVLEISAAKKSLIVLSADVVNAKDLIKLLNEVGGSVSVVKLHVDTIIGFTGETLNEVLRLAGELKFVLMHDNKFSDIGSTTKKQYVNANFGVASWAPLVTVQAVSGPDILTSLQEGAAEVGKQDTNGAILVVQMSSKGNLIKPEYTAEAIAMAEKNKSVVAAVVTQFTHAPLLLSFTPGVNGINKPADTDGLGQQYRTVRDAISSGSHFLIIGRGIMNAQNPAEEAEKYRQEAWNVMREEQQLTALKQRVNLLKPSLSLTK